MKKEKEILDKQEEVRKEIETLSTKVQNLENEKRKVGEEANAKINAYTNEQGMSVKNGEYNKGFFDGLNFVLDAGEDN